MQTKLAQVLYREQKIAYILVDANFQLIEQCGENSLFAAGERPTHLLEAVPELEGCEDILADILNGEVPRFDLENINRISATGETLYINISVLAFRHEAHLQNHLLVMLSDITGLISIQHTLTQQHNDLKLLKRSLDDTNQRLEFILQRYVPREVGAALLENRILPGLGGELREVSVLFADLRNYTSISEKLQPAQIFELLNTCLDIATTAIGEAGGVIVNYMGDAIMAIFNAPNAQEDHAKRAVRAGLNIQLMAANYQNSDESSALLKSLYFGVGINTGNAIVGNVGAQWHYQYTAIGDAVNVASRICSHARPGEVLIGKDTYRYLEDVITADALAPVKFKGKSQEITVYQVRGLEGNYLSFHHAGK